MSPCAIIAAVGGAVWLALLVWMCWALEHAPEMDFDGWD